MSLSGQWVAQYTGTNYGTIVIELDEVGDHYEGAACVWDNAPGHPSSLVRFRTPSKNPSQTMSGLQVVPMDGGGMFLTPEQLAATMPAGMAFPATADVNLQLQSSALTVQWTTPVSFGSAIATKTRAGEVSALVPRSLRNWTAFKTHVNGLERQRYVFRGQQDNRWRLRSSFYRTGRANLDRFERIDVLALQKTLSALTRYNFDLRNPLHYGAFINLAQHHGYPTPLLDWTWSPYVAAFFAYRELRLGGVKRGTRCGYSSSTCGSGTKFFKSTSCSRGNHTCRFLMPLPSTTQELSPSKRSLQCQTSTTSRPTSAGSRGYLEAIDLPARDRQGVMEEMALMGVTAGSLFPGLDGACESLRERYF